MRGGGKGIVENWKVIGRFLALLNHVVEVFKKVDVAVDILEWIVGEGKEKFEQNFLLPLIEEFKKTRRSYRVDEFTIMVNLDAPLRSPFPHAKIEKKPLGTGWVEVKRVGDKLFVGGREFILSLTDAQKTGTVPGHDLRTEMEKDEAANVHPNVVDALVEEYPKLLPDSFKVDAKGKTRFIYLWGVIFRGVGGLFVRVFCFDTAGWHRDCGNLGSGWAARDPAARLASVVSSKREPSVS